MRRSSSRNTLSWLLRGLMLGGLCWLLSSAAAAYWLCARPRERWNETPPVGLSAETLQIETRDGLELGAWFHAGDPRRVLVLLLHGMGASRTSLSPAARRLAENGFGYLALGDRRSKRMTRRKPAVLDAAGGVCRWPGRGWSRPDASVTGLGHGPALRPVWSDCSADAREVPGESPSLAIGCETVRCGQTPRRGIRLGRPTRIGLKPARGDRTPGPAPGAHALVRSAGQERPSRPSETRWTPTPVPELRRGRVFGYHAVTTRYK
jgi:hypothetical protein